MNKINTIFKELISGKFAESKKITNPQIQEAKLVPSKINERKSTLKIVIFISFDYIPIHGIVGSYDSSI